MAMNYPGGSNVHVELLMFWLGIVFVVIEVASETKDDQFRFVLRKMERKKESYNYLI